MPDFLSEDYAHTFDLLGSDNPKIATATASNNRNIILSALRIAATAENGNRAMTHPSTIPAAYIPEPPTHPTRQWCISQGNGAPPLRVILYSDGDITLCDGDDTISLTNATATLLLPALSAALRWHSEGEAADVLAVCVGEGVTAL
jgi:hypothetical protein